MRPEALPKITLLAGGVGGAKAAEGLAFGPYAEKVSIIGNIGDDESFHGLWVSPDIDTLTYSLADMIDRQQGWGIQADGRSVLTALSRLGAETWMQLGDIDFATHIYRTQRRLQGDSPAQIATDIAQNLGVQVPILLPTDDIVQTRIETIDGWLSFQEYFVQKRCQPDVKSVHFEGAESAKAHPAACQALREADIIVIAPSNPIVSIAPILALKELRTAIVESKAKCVAISPLIGGKTVKGPADQMLRAQGYDNNSAAIAEIYQEILQGLMIDSRDAEEISALQAQGVKSIAVPTLMQTRHQKIDLMTQVIEWVETWGKDKI